MPIVVGGTGLYLRAALTDLDLRPPPEPDLRARLERELAEVGPASLHGRLSADTARTVHPNDRKRIVRALELEQMGKPAAHAIGRAVVGPVATADCAVRPHDGPRHTHRADPRPRRRRCSPAARSRRWSAQSSWALRAPRARRSGFKEIAAHLDGDLSLEETRARIERGHIAYVKRQLTWMKKLAGVEIIDRTAMTAAEAAAHIHGRLAVVRSG